MGIASTNFAYFYWYSIVRSLYLSSQRISKAPSTAAELSLGAVAGALAQLFTIPLAVITTRQQTQPKGDKKGLLDTAQEVIDSEDGWSGLWRGLKASLVLVVNPSITYGAYQRLKDVMFPGRVNLKPWEAFGTSQSESGDCNAPRHRLIRQCSAWRNIEVTRHIGDTTADCCKSWPSVASTTSA